MTHEETIRSRRLVLEKQKQETESSQRRLERLESLVGKLYTLKDDAKSMRPYYTDKIFTVIMIISILLSVLMAYGAAHRISERQLKTMDISARGLFGPLAFMFWMIVTFVVSTMANIVLVTWVCSAIYIRYYRAYYDRLREEHIKQIEEDIKLY